MAHKITKKLYDEYKDKAADLKAKRNSTYDPMARIQLTKKLEKLERFLASVEVVV